jgi:hypothetical protein
MIYGEIVGVEQTQDAQKNIIIWISFTQDGIEIPFYRGADLLVKDRKKVWPLYARFENFLGKTPEMIQKWIQINVEAQIGNIIKEINSKEILNASFITAIDKLKGVKFSADKVSIPVDTICAGENNTTIELKSDGTYLVK